MEIFIDECLRATLATRLRQPVIEELVKLGVESPGVFYVPTKFGRGVQDEEWIPMLTPKLSMVISADFGGGPKPKITDLCLKQRVALFSFSSQLARQSEDCHCNLILRHIRRFYDIARADRKIIYRVSERQGQVAFVAY